MQLNQIENWLSRLKERNTMAYEGNDCDGCSVVANILQELLEDMRSAQEAEGGSDGQ